MSLIAELTGHHARPSAETAHGAGNAQVAVALLALTVVLAMSTWFSIAPVAEPFTQATRLGAGGLRLATVAVPLGFATGAVASALMTLADRWPPQRLLATGALGAALANAVPLLRTTPAAAVASRAAVGAALALVLPIALKTTATWVSDSRGTAMGVILAGLCLGTASPHLIAAWGQVSWRHAVGATSLLAAGGAVVAVSAVRNGPYPYSAPPFDPRRALTPLRDRVLRRVYAGYFGHMWELYAAWAWLGAYTSDRLGAGPAASTVTAAAIAAGAVGAITEGRTGDRRGHSCAARRALLASGGCAVLLALTHSSPAPVTAILAIGWGYWVIADSAHFTTLVTRHADHDLVGTAVTLQLAIGFSLTTVTLWLVPAIRDAAGWSWALLLLAPGPFLGRLAMTPLEQQERTPS
jgi:predicted MFS family arabinose efflux permease